MQKKLKQIASLLKGESLAKVNNIFFAKNTHWYMSLTEKKKRNFYRFHSLRKRASFQHSNIASTEWVKLYMTSQRERTLEFPLMGR